MIAKDKKIVRLTALFAPVALAAGLGVSVSVQAADSNFATTSRNVGVTTGYGECWQSVGGTAGVAPCVKEEPKPVAAAGVMDSDGDGVPDDKDKCPGTRKGAKVDANGCEIVPDLTIDLVNDEFDFDKSTLKPDMKAALDDVASRVKASEGDEHLMIVGHTDSVGSDAYNQGLSERRAKSTADYLVKKGVAGNRISTKGMGESQPVADNKTKAGRAKNRRVEILTK